MKRLETMNILEVLGEVGYIIKVRDIGTCISDSKVLSEFIKKESECDKDFSKFMSFLQENEKYIDKQKLILNAIYNCNEILEQIRTGKISIDMVEDNPENLYKYIENGKNLLGKKNKTKLIRVMEKEDGKIEVTYLQSKDLYYPKEGNKQNKINQIEEKISLEDILRDVHVEDINLFFTEEDKLALGIMAKIIYNSMSDKDNNMISKRKDLIRENKIIEYAQDIPFEEVKDEYIKSIKEYSNYIDLDKLILTSAFRTFYHLENDECDENETKKAKEKLDKLEELLQKRKNNIEINGNIYTKNDSDSGKLETQIVKFSKNNFKKLKNKYFYKNKYYTGKELEKLEKDLLDGKIELDEIDCNVCRMIELDKKEIRFLVQKDDKNCIYLLKNNLITVNEVINHIHKNGISSELLQYLYTNGYISNSLITDLYEEGKIDACVIGNLRDDENIQKILTNEKMIAIYDESKTEEDKIKLQKYSLLYKELKIKGKNGEELRKQADELLLDMDEKFDQEDLKPLYRLGIIPIETTLEWGGQGIAIEMLKEGFLKPSDTKALFEKGIITIKEIENILQSIELTNTEKLDIIYSTFDEIEQEEIRNRLVQLLDVEKIQKEKNDYPAELKTRQAGTTKNRKAYRTDPCLRYKLIDILDKNYDKKLLIDGHIVFHLPNLNRGTYIIEKMFKDTKKGIKPDYGRATYILNEEMYMKNKKEIIDSDIINRPFLTRLKEERKIISLNHSNRWGENLIRELGINNSNSKYQEADLQKINNLIKAIEKSRREIE